MITAIFSKLNTLYHNFKRHCKSRFWIPLCSKHPFLASFYYFLIDRSFGAEHFAVLNGISQHTSGSIPINVAYRQLKRNIHRIEKGIITPDRKLKYGKDYISFTIDCLIKVKDEHKDLDMFSHACQVLNVYFKQQENDKEILKEFSRFLSISATNLEVGMVPYSYSSIEKANITLDNFVLLSKQRRSVRYFLDKKVDKDVIEKAASVALLSPSACNRQSFRLIIVDDAMLLKQVSKIPMGTSSYAEQIPVMAFIVGDLAAYPEVRDRHLIYIDGSLWAMSFAFALETLSLSSCMINWPDINNKEKQLRSLLAISDTERCIMCFAIGYADPSGGIPYSFKSPVADFITYNR